MGYVLGNYPLMGPPFPPYWAHLTSKSCFPLAQKMSNIVQDKNKVADILQL